jgi:hypothetical protein
MADESLTDRMDDIAFYLHLRSRLEHEDNLIVNRVLWLMASQSFLFTAYAIALNGTGTRQHALLMKVLGVVGIVSGALIFVGILAAVQAMAWIRALLRERVPEVSRLGLPPLHSPGRVVPGLAAPILLPPTFVVVWLYLLCAI